MSALMITMTLGGATGWVVCSYVYGQLSSSFKQAKPMAAGALAGGVSGLVGLAVVSLVTHLLSK